MDIPGAKFAYNPSIVKEESGMYRLFYRVDGGKVQKRVGSTYYDSRIGSILLDKNFVPQGKGNFVEGLPPTAEDPRAARYNGKTVLTYSGLLDCKYYARGIFRCTVDENNCASKPQLYDVRSRIVEKNWVPFVHCDSEGKQSLNLVYHFHPYKVFCEQNEGRALVPYPLRFREGYLPQNWSEHWGEIRGGTSLELFDGKYLSFFHSMTYKKKRYTYHFGAMIHEAKPPFRIKEISRMP
ncbi:MAG: hypothetical protein P0S94_00440, partial [Simkaniaceae bacterium]|nr:hypothetical protein [Simkaniaceae bacterium]